MKLFVDASLLIYLNIPLPQDAENLVEEFFKGLLVNELYTNILVLDEVICVSEKKYKIAKSDTIDFLDNVVIPFINILPLRELEYFTAKRHIIKYNLNPSDAIHLATIDNYGLNAIVTEDKDFDRTHVKRLWIDTAQK
ncbi:MAG: type II toxin-antitoxin system VapC family toxin [Candidatus Njordarchaeales archaeon]